MTDAPKPAETSKRQGHCLCGAVQITAHEASKDVGACHCAMCRRWGGGPFIELDCGTNVTVSGEDHISAFSSSEWAERCFCKTCGTNLFYRLKETGQHMIAAGIFDDQDDLAFKTQVFIDEKPSYYSFTEKTNNMTGDELMAMFAPELE